MAKIIENKLEQKVCGSCDEPFGCGAKLESCWCTEVKLSAEAADELKAKFNDCLCASCLLKVSEAKEPA